MELVVLDRQLTSDGGTQRVLVLRLRGCQMMYASWNVQTIITIGSELYTSVPASIYFR